MERLTTRNNDGIGVLKQPYQCERCGDLQWSLPDLGNGSPIDRLAEYEDLEEQGKLIKLPCKVGDTVFQLVKHNAFIRKLEIVNFVVFSNDEIYMKCEEDGNSYGEIDIDEVGKTVFLTPEEAEAALKGREEI